MSIGYLADVFDLLNVRDLDVIAQAAARCSRLVVGVYTDEYAESVLGRRPIVPLVERLTLVEHVRGVAQAVVHDETSSDSASDVTFVLADRIDMGCADDRLIIPGRHTTSSILQSALDPVDRSAVA